MLNKKRSKGFSIVEVLVAFAVLSIVIVAAILTQVNTFNINRQSKDRIFAGQKATQMMEELKGLVEGNGENASDSLDLRRNGSSEASDEFSAVLTTEKLKGSTIASYDSRLESTLPLDETSGNYQYGSKWRFLRQVIVERIPGESRARKVTVKVFYTNPKSDEIKPTPLVPALAQLTSILRTNSTPNPPSQVIDTYALALNTIPGWWAPMPEMRLRYDAISQDLRDKNVGLDFKSHFIAVTSFGRDLLYSPYINDAVVANDDTNSKFAYFYPGKIRNTETSNRIEFYYSLADISGTSPARSITNPGSGLEFRNDFDMSNPKGNNFAVADQFNNAMRYPDELATYMKLRQNSILKDPKNPMETTYRLLIEDMATSKDYRNAILSNLHGELYPSIPIRNYSDSAKDMVNPNNAYLRVVTHPERLSYDSNSLNPLDVNGITPLDPDGDGKFTAAALTPNNNRVNLRVYTYKRTPNGVSASNYVDGNITVFIPLNNDVSKHTTLLDSDKTLYKKLQRPYQEEIFNKNDGTPISNVEDKIRSNISLTYIDGDPNSSPAVPYSRVSVPSSSSNVVVNPVFDFDGDGDIQNADGTPEVVYGILMVLKNPEPTRKIPTVASQVATGLGGLPSSKKLYGMDYIPTPLSSNLGTLPTDGAKGFGQDRDLTAIGDIVKNTARWIISINVNSPSSNRDDSDYNPLYGLNQKMMTVETRFGDDLNTGTRMDSSFVTTTGVPSVTPTLLANIDEVKSRMPNLSRTFVWIRPTFTPYTEQFQIIGDPRYNPYKDVLDNNGINPVFNKDKTAISKILTTAGNYECLAGKISNSIYGSNYVNNDVPRLFEIFRKSLLNSNAVYSSLLGYTHYYYGIGGEIGLDSANSQTFTVNGAPFNNGSFINIIGTEADEITNGTAYVVGSNWYSIPFIGELYPDDVFNSQWKTNGNLTAPTFYRAKINSYSFDGVQFIAQKVNKRLQVQGCASMFNGGGSENTGNNNFFNHGGDDQTAILSRTVSGKIGMGDDLNKSMGTYFENITANREFFIASGGNTPPERGSGFPFVNEYKNLNTRLTFLKTPTISEPHATTNPETSFYYKSNDSNAPYSSIIKFYRDRDGKSVNSDNNRGYVIASGLKPTVDSGALQVVRFNISSMIYAFFRTADVDSTDTSNNPSVPIPYIAFTSKNAKNTDILSSQELTTTPDEGSEVNTNTLRNEWVVRWRRWDGKKYSDVYNDTWTPDSSITIKYNLLYSKAGKDWLYHDGTPVIGSISTFNPSKEVEVGTGSNKINLLPVRPQTVTPAYDGDTNLGVKRYAYDWDLSDTTKFPKNESYTFRVQAYRFSNNELINQHYSYHQRELFIKELTP